MRDNIYISTLSFKEKSLKKILDLCLKHEITNIELGSNVGYAEDNLDAVYKLNRNPIRFLVHNYFPRPSRGDFVLNLASDDERIITKSLELCKNAIDLSARLGASFYSVHSGSAFNVRLADLGNPVHNPGIIPYEKAYKTLVRNVIILNEYARSKGVGLLIENHEVSKDNLINGKNKLLLGSTAEELLTIYSDVDSNNFGFLIDVGHLKVTAKTFGFRTDDFVTHLGSKIKAFHISDNDGCADLHLKFDDSAWFKEIIGRFNGILVIESQNLKIEELLKCRDYLSGMSAKVKIG